MRNRYLLGAIFLAITAPMLTLQQRPSAQSEQANQVLFDPHDFSGVWWVNTPGPETIFARAKNNDANKCETCHPSEHTALEPPLTPWAREHARIADNGFHSPEDTINTSAPSMPANRNSCEPIGIPAQFWYTQLYPFEFVVTSDRIFQFFEKQNEWRAIWMKRGHPRNLDPTYMGDSVGRWEGDALVVDTIGFNGKARIEPVGISHLMSDSFHVVERWRRASLGTMELDVTYYDSKVWGDKLWGGLSHKFLLQPNAGLIETYCTAEDNSRFDEFIKPALQPVHK